MSRYLTELASAEHHLLSATIASCTCLTKIPDTQYHSNQCHYKRISLMLDEIQAIKEDNASVILPYDEEAHIRKTAKGLAELIMPLDD
jgi:hypothetical protein